jgi:hypothetical protein
MNLIFTSYINHGVKITRPVVGPRSVRGWSGHGLVRDRFGSVRKGFFHDWFFGVSTFWHLKQVCFWKSNFFWWWWWVGGGMKVVIRELDFLNPSNREGQMIVIFSLLLLSVDFSKTFVKKRRQSCQIHNSSLFLRQSQKVLMLYF